MHHSHYKLIATALLILVSCLVFNTSVHADDPSSYSTTAAVTVAASCTMEGTVNTAHTASIANGAYTENIGKTTLSTSCNDPNGYAIYAIGYTGDSYTGTNHTKLIGANTNLTIDTGTYTAGTTTGSVWSMKLSPVTGSSAPTIENSYNNYNVVPDNFTKVASLSSATNPTLGSNLETTYAVYIGGNQAADTYTGQVKYVLVHPSTNTAGTYTVAYNANGGSGTMAPASNIYNFEPFTLPDSTFTSPSGYQFAGWCATQDTTATPQTACQGQFYEAGDSVTSLGSANTTVTLYAVWEELPRYMQDFTASMCKANASDSDYTLYDRRDESDYTVRYINGNCWMTQNLRITGIINATDSNFTTSPYGGNATSINVSEGDLNMTITASDYQTYTAPRSHLADATDVSSANANGASYTATDLGAWYNYCAASAGEVCQGSTAQSATQDICPAGWRLPTKSENSGIRSYASSFSPVYGGYYYRGSISNATTYGYWWSATSYNAFRQYYLYYSNGSLNTGGDYRSYAYYVRCIRSDDGTM